jgi:hypothetical protein
LGKTLNHSSIQDLKRKQTRTTVTSVAGDQRGQPILFSVVFTPSTSSHYGRAGIFKALWSPGIDAEASIPPAYVAWRAGTITLFLLGA